MEFTVDTFRLLQSGTATLLWIAAIIYVAAEYKEDKDHKNPHFKSYILFLIITYFSVLGIFFSHNLYTAFVFFEIMSFTSYVLVIQDRSKEAKSAGNLYLAVAVAGGLSILFGLFLFSGAMSDQNLYLAGYAVLIGFGAKAGMAGLHIWMGDTYTYAPAPISALLSGVLSKTGIYGILLITTLYFMGDTLWGSSLFVMGLITMVMGGILALFSSNMKRLLAYSSMSQIGFMILGCGMTAILKEEGNLAFWGCCLHMINHALIKCILFFMSGMIQRDTGSLELQKIKGYGKHKPMLHFIFGLCALGLSGVPLFNGYISKTMLHESITEAAAMGTADATLLLAGEWIFIICGGLTVAYMVKLYVALFVKKEENLGKEARQSTNRRIPVMASMFLFVIIMILIGIPSSITMHLFSFSSLKSAAFSLSIGAVIYLAATGFCRKDIHSWPHWLDFGVLCYKPFIMKVLPGIGTFFSRICDSFVDGCILFLRRTIFKDALLPHELEEGNSLTYSMGSLFNSFLWFKKNRINYVHLFAVKWNELDENQVLIARSLSFGLLLFCLGLCSTLIYLLI